MLADEGVRDHGRLVGFSVREPGKAAPDLDVAGYHALLAEAADFVVHRFGADVLFVPIERDDIRHSHAVIGRMLAADRAHVLKGTYSPQQLLGLMDHLDLVVGMRLHFLLFAALGAVPFLPLPYAAKVTDFVTALGVPPPARVSRESAGPLLAAIDRAWDCREQQRAQLLARLPEVPGPCPADHRPGRRSARAAGAVDPDVGGLATYRAAAAQAARPGLARCCRPGSAQVAAETEVLVVGGGPAGIGAAVGAARAGAQVLLVERYGFFGGNATAALVMPWMSAHTRHPRPPRPGELTLMPQDHGVGGELVVRGVWAEIIEGMVEAAAALPPSPETGYTVPFDPEAFKTFTLDLLDQSGVTYLLHAFASGVLEPGPAGPAGSSSRRSRARRSCARRS